jgi:hypothetical protein
LVVSHQFIYRSLVDIVGSNYVSDDPAIRQAYSKDPAPAIVLRKYAKDPLTLPDFVVLPGNTEEVQAVVRIANRYGFKVIPVTTGDNIFGFCIPTEAKTIILHLKRMDKILEIDEENMTATIQPYVSVARLQSEAMKRKLWNGGTPLAPSSNGELSNIMFVGGMWQSALAYGYGVRSLISMVIVLPNGDILRTGSSALPNSGSFMWRGLGPDLRCLFEMANFGSLGICTEATVKLYPWAGGEWPQEEIYDRPPLPSRHEIYFIEYPNYESLMNGIYEICHSGIGTHLNVPSDAILAMMSQPTQAAAEKLFKEGFFPPHLIYVVLAGISSEKQLEYERKVLKQIVEETGGRIRTDELAEILSNWHADAFRSGDTVRMTRPGLYTLGRMSETKTEYRKETHEVHQSSVKTRPHHVMDEGWPWTYVYDRGYFSLHETDIYGDLSKEEDAKIARDIAVSDVRSIQKDGLGYTVFMEPLTSWFGPKVGPNFNLLIKKIKEIFDPNDTLNPNKLIKMKASEK